MMLHQKALGQGPLCDLPPRTKMLLTSAFFALAIAGTASAQTLGNRYGLLSATRPEIGFANYNTEQKLLVANQVKEMFKVFVHQYEKEDVYGVNALEKVDKIIKDAPGLSNRDFQYRMVALFQSLRDLHTNYYVAGPHNCYNFVQPLQFAFVESEDYLKKPKIAVKSYTVDKNVLARVPGIQDKVKIGDLLTKIDGKTWPEYFDTVKADTGGANQYGGYQRALQQISSKRGRSYKVPAKNAQVFTFQSSNSTSTFDITVPWVTVASKDCLADAPTGGAADPKNNALGKTEQKYHGKPKKPRTDDASVDDWGTEFFSSDLPAVAYAPTASSIVSYTIYRNNGANLGVIRLSAFTDSAPSDGETTALNEVKRLLTDVLADTDSIVIDLRTNGGGSLGFADVMPQFWVNAPNGFDTGYGRAINHPNNGALFNGPANEEDWAAAYNATPKGNKYTNTIKFNEASTMNTIGQLYLRPVALLTDAKCYSACDTFSASMQDHGFTVFGEDATTGAGGANVIEHQANLQAWAPSIYKPLPYQELDSNGKARLGVSNFRVAWRQTIRTGPNKGKLIEDAGIKSTYQLRPTVQDFVADDAKGVSSQFDRIAKYFKTNSNEQKKAGLLFQASLNATTVTVGKTFTIPFTSQKINTIELRDANNKVVTKTNPTPVDQKHKGTLEVVNGVATLGRSLFTIQGFNGNQRVLITRREFTVIPNTSAYLKVAAGQKYTLGSKDESAYTHVYNNPTNNAADAWQYKNGKLVLGNGIKYKSNVESALKIFVNLPASSKLSATFDVDSEKDYDYFFVTATDASGNTVELYRTSGTVAATATWPIPFSGNVYLSIEFTSDGGVVGRGATVKDIIIGS
ncbi:uncharacterized protein EV422DRAFT_528592 [Fimicolochytrium jonesii]|uniref:uncharacterized protein n=1 Tax=Fimicolochytrium jonesii TaxID=1396493 RepID=UPI0022FE227C|nr:uncharacterized protein EV422DRAFT_528592 [Fimicolochytrium jonesii]KAI8820971.1 hypothetical protein EV422DRAFT_528592 [Fimicolochytrium jonesii]